LLRYALREVEETGRRIRLVKIVEKDPLFAAELEEASDTAPD